MTFPLINDWQQKSWENSLHSHCVPSFLKLIFTTASSPDVSTRDFPGKRQHPGQVTEKKRRASSLLSRPSLRPIELIRLSLSLYRFPRHNIKYFSFFYKNKVDELSVGNGKIHHRFVKTTHDSSCGQLRTSNYFILFRREPAHSCRIMTMTFATRTYLSYMILYNYLEYLKSCSTVPPGERKRRTIGPSANEKIFKL